MLRLDEAGRGRTRARRLRRPRALDPWVEGGWIQRPLPGRRAPWRVVPDPSPHLLVIVRGTDADRRVTASVVGARTRWVDADPARLFTVVVRFRPGALPSFAQRPALDFTDRAVPIHDVLPHRADEIVGPAHVDPPERVAERVFAILGEELREAPVPDWKIRGFDHAAALEGQLPARPREIAKGMGLAARTLRAAVTNASGLSPSGFLRVRRIHMALLLGLYGTSGSWSRVASDAGYYDHAHLIRESHALLGETPAAFIRRSGRDRCRSVQDDTSARDDLGDSTIA